ncbi:hypothetical protein HZA57_05280 [Candidatus Poribacteria bacterium]|nr:hypothetical protein [Candidatus Poribacteria bacterium]
MWWILGASALALALHKAVEGIVCASGNCGRRKFLWDMATAGVFLLLLLAAWIMVMAVASWRQYGLLLLAVTPVALAGIGLFAHLSRIAYEDGAFDSIGTDEE